MFAHGKQWRYFNHVDDASSSVPARWLNTEDDARSEISTSQVRPRPVSLASLPTPRGIDLQQRGHRVPLFPVP